jgi:replicative DNA helicase
MSKKYDKKEEIEIKRTPNEELELLAKKEEPRFMSILLKDKSKLQDAIAFGITKKHFRTKENAYLYYVAQKNIEKNNGLLTKGAMESIMMQQKCTEEQRSARVMHWHKIYGLEKDNEDYERLRDNINNRFIQDQVYTIFEESMSNVVGATASQDIIIKELQNKMNSLKGVDADGFDRTVEFSDGVKEALEYINERREKPDENVGVMTHIKAIDEEFYGFDYGSYTVISGMTNGGKTTLMFNIGFNMARYGGKNVVYVSLEKKALPLNVRLLCLHALVDYNRVKRGGKEDWGVSDEVWAKLVEAENELSSEIKPNFDIIQLSQDDTLTKILSKVEEIKTKKNIDVIILDYLGCVGFESHTVGRPDLDLARVSKRFQSYCKRNNIVGITGIQITKASTKEIRKKTENVGESDDIQKIAIQSEDLAGIW